MSASFLFFSSFSSSRWKNDRQENDSRWEEFLVQLGEERALAKDGSSSTSLDRQVNRWQGHLLNITLNRPRSPTAIRSPTEDQEEETSPGERRNERVEFDRSS